MQFRFGQRIRTTTDTGGLITPLVPAGSYGTVIHPLDAWGDIGILLDCAPNGVIRAYGEDQLAVVADAPAWLQP